MNPYSSLNIGVIAHVGGFSQTAHIMRLIETKPLERIIIVGDAQQKKTNLASLIESESFKITNPFPIDKLKLSEPLNRKERREKQRKRK